MECHSSHFTVVGAHLLLLGMHQSVILDQADLLLSCGHCTVVDQFSVHNLCLEKVH